ncbi:hypothetical protein [Pseudomonas nitroreducens]|uniref:hypothetical protein n=1 Tax=Pseudomonas nitroreducens TaxID=46680 RepID=UPI003CC81166
MERLNDLPLTAGIDVQADRCAMSAPLSSDPDSALARADLALQEARLAREVQALNKKRLALGLCPVLLDLRSAGAAASAEAPSVREVVRMLDVFGRAICLTEEIARAGQGGVVRVKEALPVVIAINAYLASLPVAAAVER